MTVSEFAWQTHTIQNAFAASHLASFAGSFTGSRSFDDLAANDLRIIGALLQIVRQCFGNDIFHRRTYLARHQLIFGLAAELGFRHFDRQHAAQAFTHIVARDFNLGFFGKFVFFDVLVDDTRHRSTQTCQVSAAIALWNVVGEAQNVFVVTIVPLHGHFYANAGAWNATIGLSRTVTFGIKRIGMQDLLARVDEVHETLDTASTRKVIFLTRTFVQ